MNGEQEHDVVPRIRAWLAATSGVEIPTGLSREEARRTALDLLNRIEKQNINPEAFEVDDDAKDAFWSLVEELRSGASGLRTFEACDGTYKFISAIAWEDDHCNERNEILHQIAHIGWRSSPDGIEGVTKRRAAIWERGDQKRYRDLCSISSSLTPRVEGMKSQNRIAAEDIYEICSNLLHLPGARPLLAQSLAVTLYGVLADSDRQIGHLDDRSFLAGTVSLLGGVADRTLGNWDSAQDWYCRAASAYRRSLDPAYTQRVEVERLALQYSRYENDAVIRSAPDLIRDVKPERENARARFLLGSAQLAVGQFVEAHDSLSSVVAREGCGAAPVLRAAALIKLGAAISGLGHYEDAEDVFSEAAGLAYTLEYPYLIGNLAGELGEHLARIGRLEEAVRVYRSAARVYFEAGMARFTAYLAVLTAELLVLLGRNSDAESELLGALNLIGECHLEREGVAALALLREAVVGRRKDAKKTQTVKNLLRRGLR